MDLTSGAFVALMAVLTVAAVAATVVLWPRLSPQRPLPVLGRLGALLGVNLLLLVTIGLVANDTFGFFADWTDLAGALTSAPPATRTTKGSTSPNAAAEAHVGGPQLSAGAHIPALPKEATGNREYSSSCPERPATSRARSSSTSRPATRIRSRPRRRYPVIETFHGYPGRPEQWLDSMALGEVLDEEVAAGRMTPTIVLAPELEIPPGRDTECVNGGDAGPAMETWLTTDVPDWAARTLRVKLDRASWAAAGFSAGAWCAAMVALLHPSRYGAALIFGGYFHPVFSPTYVPFTPGSAQWRRYDLVALIKRAPPPLAIWMEISHSEHGSYRTSAAFLAAARPPMSVRLVEFAHASHTILFWAPLVPQAMRWLETIGGFRTRS